LQALTDVTGYAVTRIFVSLNNRFIGQIDIANDYQPIGATRLRDLIVNKFNNEIVKVMLAAHFRPDAENYESAPARLPAGVPVSVVLATRDRPAHLRKCLACLVAQETARPVEIIVVDNNPNSGQAAEVVAEFPGVILIAEHRAGLSYARNKGITSSTGDIIISTDDDVTMPADWLEKLVAPFVRPDVMIVTGNVLPLELETTAQCLFEGYGGLGRGFEPRVVDRNWFKQFRDAVRTWELGATANAAFRSTIFNHSEIGLMDEALGAGTPTGCSEDTYVFYRTLKAGFAIAYEPTAYVWHEHRRDEEALRRQIYNYSKGHVAYHLTTWMRDHDRRAWVRLLFSLPLTYLRRMKARLFGGSDYPLSLIFLEIAGSLAGPWALWQSRRRVKREGYSDPYVPVSLRAANDAPSSSAASRAQ
jgi:glycosyltransferase involved in cell wall biosynthesis